MLGYLAAVCCASVAVATSVSRRVLPLVDIDEAGYLQFARSHYLALEFNGVPAYLDSVLHQAVFAPLVPAVGALVQFFAGGEPMSALGVNVFFFAVAGVAAFLIGLQLGGHAVAWLTGLMSMGSLGLIDYAATFQFEEAVVAFSALAFLFALRSRGFASLGYSALMGVAIGLMALSRTMTVAFVPAFFVAGLVWLVVSPKPRRPRFLGLATAAAATILVAAPWYLVNATGILNYLFNFGYGSQSKEYATTSGGVFDLGSWQKVTRGLGESTVGPLVGITLLVGLLLLVIKVVLGHQRRFAVPRWLAGRLSMPLVFVALTTFFFVVALVSSRNSSLSFFPVLIVPLSALSAVGLAMGASRFVWGIAVVGVALVFCLNTSVKAQLFPGVDWPEIPVPFGSLAPMTNDHTNFDVYQSKAGHAVLTTEDVMIAAPWQESISALREFIATESPASEVAFGFRHKLVNPNSVELDYSLTSNANFPTRMIDPQVLDTSDSGLSEWLIAGSGPPACILLTALGTSGEFEPHVDQDALARVAVKDGYTLIDRVPLGSDRVIMAFKNAAYCAQR